jgi:hypothetical protein
VTHLKTPWPHLESHWISGQRPAKTTVSIKISKVRLKIGKMLIVATGLIRVKIGLWVSWLNPLQNPPVVDCNAYFLLLTSMDLRKVMVRTSRLKTLDYSSEILNQKIPRKSLIGLVLWNFNV